MIDDIPKKLYDIDLVIEDIKKFPQTYKTILGKHYTNGTYQLILRRKLSKLHKSGLILKTSIPGTRFGEIIFFVSPKDYFILIEAGRLGSNAYCFFKFENLDKFNINVKELWKLDGGCWIRIDGRVFFDGNILKIL